MRDWNDFPKGMYWLKTALKWTTEPPIEEVWYWAKYSQDLRGGVVIVYVVPEHTHVKIIGDEMGEHKSWFTHWLGPIPEPELPQ